MGYLGQCTSFRVKIRNKFDLHLAFKHLLYVPALFYKLTSVFIAILISNTIEVWRCQGKERLKGNTSIHLAISMDFRRRICKAF